VWVELATATLRGPIPATLTANYPRSRISPRWAEGFNVSDGQSASVRFLDRDVPFGMEVTIVPEFEPLLDKAFDDLLLADALGRVWYRCEGIALGHDVLQHFVVTHIGPKQVTMVSES